MMRTFMDRANARYLVTSTLLDAGAPLTLAELVAAAGVGRQGALGALWSLLDEERIVETEPGPRYAWAGARAPRAEGAPGLDDAHVRAFHEMVVSAYRPPADKPFLVFFQCSIRRPFSKSPSHASMRRAVATATGHDPANDFDSCPAHVVVLAGRIGPVPYELEGFYPANVRGECIPSLGPGEYERVKPVLAERMADYLAAHAARYDRIAAFTSGRYGEVMGEAAERAGVSFPIFPSRDGPAVESLGGSKPRTYWERYWIQLHDEIAGWLSVPLQEAARARLEEIGVTRA